MSLSFRTTQKKLVSPKNECSMQITNHFGPTPRRSAATLWEAEKVEVRSTQRDMTPCCHVSVSSGEPLAFKLICHTCHSRLQRSQAFCLSSVCFHRDPSLSDQKVTTWGVWLVSVLANCHFHTGSRLSDSTDQRPTLSNQPSVLCMCVTFLQSTGNGTVPVF